MLTVVLLTIKVFRASASYHWNIVKQRIVYPFIYYLLPANTLYRFMLYLETLKYPAIGLYVQIVSSLKTQTATSKIHTGYLHPCVPYLVKRSIVETTNQHYIMAWPYAATNWPYRHKIKYPVLSLAQNILGK